MSSAHLYTFWISHFSEKARWGLLFEGVSFKESALLPGPHVLTVRRLAPKQQVPLLVHDGEAIQGSCAIFDAIPRLFGKSRLQPWVRDGDEASRARAHELEAMADESFGRAIQAFGYDSFLRDREAVIKAWSHEGPWWASAFYALTFPGIERALRRGYCRDAEYVRESRKNLLAALDVTDALLEKQPYLMGERPSRPDVAVAALLSPLVRPPEHPLPWPVFPEPLESFCLSLEERPTYRLVQRMYREHRGGPQS